MASCQTSGFNVLHPEGRGTHSATLNRETLLSLGWTEDHNLCLMPQYFRGRDDVVANSESPQPALIHRANSPSGCSGQDMPSVELKYYSSNLTTADVLLPGPRSHGSGHSHLSSVMGSSGPIRIPASRSGEKDVQLFCSRKGHG